MGKIIDISYHNGDIDFAQLKKEADLVIIRVQYGSKFIDPKYKEYVAGCKKYGIPFAHYAYGHYVSVNDAIVEANDFMDRADKDAKFLVLDTEDDTLKSCGGDKLAEASQAFIDTLKKAGWKVGFYVSNHMIDGGDPYGLLKVKADFRWIPVYGTNDGQPHTKPKFPCELWQYTDNGKASGITGGGVDLNLLSGDKDLNWFLGIVPAPKKDESIFFQTGGLIGEGLEETRAFLKENNWWFDTKVGTTKSIVFLVGGFAKDSDGYNKLKKFLTDRNWWFAEKKYSEIKDWR